MGGLFSSSPNYTPSPHQSHYIPQEDPSYAQFQPSRQKVSTNVWPQSSKQDFSTYVRPQPGRQEFSTYGRSQPSRQEFLLSSNTQHLYQQPTGNARSTRPKSAFVSRLPLTPSVYHQPDADKWSPLPCGKSFHLVNLKVGQDDYECIRSAFKSTTQKRFKVLQIKRVENPYLLGCYLLKKEEMLLRYGSIKEERYFHGTQGCNVDKICENNFDWKLHGDSVGNRFGMGVSFSPISYYAAHYSDRSDVNIMFYARVLVNTIIVGNKGMILPPKKSQITNTRYDSAGKKDGHVIVKFCDSEFYPEFIIYYTGTTFKSPPKHKVQNTQRHLSAECEDFGNYYVDDHY